MEVLLWFPWAALVFWLTDQLPLKDAAKRGLCALIAMGGPLAVIVVYGEPEVRAIALVWGGLTTVALSGIAWLSAGYGEPGPPPASPASQAPPRALACFREAAEAHCPWDACRPRCLFAPEDEVQ
ncbi:hypothetical protein AB0G79_20200 [Streptomyces sp. NPDC020807]|uniref:hypothetical protein n=1 Tax=Streptomyces sp. NPDC020807 TaxID=3155119 RepID=UPI0033E0B16A